MEHPRTNGGDSVSCPAAPPVSEVRDQLERILESPQFRASRRCQRLLRHVTEHALVGDVSVLKERALGLEVFGRAADYDTSLDPIVRGTAAETRKKLAQYYQDASHDQELRIELIAGSYVPEFHYAHQTPHNKEVVHSHRRSAIIVGLFAALAGIGLLGRLWFARAPSELDQFWTPILAASGPVFISLGQPVAYNLISSQAQDRIQGAAVDSSPGAPAPSERNIPVDHLVILRDRYVAVGDAVCLARIAALLEKHDKPYRIRGEGSTSSSDLSENATVLVGAFDNQWTLRAGGQLRFTFFKDSARETDMVRDRLHPERTDWRLTGAWPHWEKISNDYAIVSRLLDPNTDRPVIIAAGITHFGTMAAGELVTNPEYFSEVAAQLPHGWDQKNLQFVLRVPVVQGAAGRPRVLATHVW